MTTAELEMTPWWSHPDELSALYLFLVDTDRLDPRDVREVAYMLSKPWKFCAEHAEMIARRNANDADELVAQLEGTAAAVHGKVSAIRKGRPVVIQRRRA